jgi:hypothetical protein
MFQKRPQASPSEAELPPVRDALHIRREKVGWRLPLADSFQYLPGDDAFRVPAR